MYSDPLASATPPCPGHDDLDLLFHPSRRYARPADVLSDPQLSIEECRAILSSWASDACAVESAPALRRPPFAAQPVTFDEVMDALTMLDRTPVRAKKRRPDDHEQAFRPPR